jgi:L-lactate dehydrogenase complex protein LldG
VSAARAQILDAVRSARGALPERTASHAQSRQALLPPRFVREAPDLADLFLHKLDAVSASHAVLPSFRDLPDHLSTWFARQGMLSRFLLAPEPLLMGLDWASSRLSPLSELPNVLTPRTIVSGAFAGVAETGSIALLTNGMSRPSHNLLAQTQVVVVERTRIVAAMEDVWIMTRRAGLPRSLVFVTGPSRTADVEMTLELGVHGAVAVHVVLIGDFERENA